ncbi:MAG: hypothetical protein ACLP1X_02155 [Polyangiaceae bacterium]
MHSTNKWRTACLGALIAAASVFTGHSADAACATWTACIATNPQTTNCSTSCSNGSSIAWTSLWEYDPDFSEYIAQENVTSFTNDTFGYYQDEYWHCASSGWHEPGYTGPHTGTGSWQGTCAAGDAMNESEAWVYID